MHNVSVNYLQVADPSKQWVADRIVTLLTSDSILPTFPDIALRLCTVVQKEDATVDDFADLISLDAALTARCIQVASSITFAARPIESIRQALMMIGVQQIRRIALAVATIGAFSEFKAKVDWRRFWFHNVLVARLSDRVAGTFRQTNGMEYLAGLLHDVGKLLIEHYFPSEFEQVIAGALQKQCPYATLEREILGLDHTQIGAAICECMGTHPHVMRAVWFHHDPLNVSHTTDSNGDGGFLSVCVRIADRLARSVDPNPTQPPLSEEQIVRTPEWVFLQHFYLPQKLEVDVQSEVKKAQADMVAFVG